MKLERKIRVRSSNETEKDFMERMKELRDGINVFYENQKTEWSIFYMWERNGNLTECIFQERHKK